MKTKFALIATLAVLAASLAGTAAGKRATSGWQDARVSALRSGIAWQRDQTWRWQHLAGLARTRSAFTERRETSLSYLRWLARLWNARREAAYKAYKAYQKRFAGLPPHYSAWLCIHHYEGAWNDPNPPYYGGLQMDMNFMRTYGGSLLATKGTADHWTPLEQMFVAERAWKERGFTPWPNTARYCGLL